MEHFNKYDLAMYIAITHFKNHTDKGGSPYINHLLRVTESVPDCVDNTYKIVALLHDLLEEFPYYHNTQLIETLFDEEISDAVYALTKTKKQSYEQYIDQVCQNRIAMIVKLADLKDNMDISRLTTISNKDMERLVKYHNAYNFIKSKSI